MKKFILAAILAASSLTGSAFAAALPDPINNFSFQSAFDTTGDGIGNWTIAINPAGLTIAEGGLTPTNGSLMAFTNGPGAGGGSGGAFIFQRLGSPGTFQAGTYTFTLDIGLRNDVGIANSYDVAFYSVNPVANTLSATLARQTLAKTTLGWETQQFQFTLTGAESYFATDVIQITLGTPTGVQINYDNVQGSFTPVPEPSTYAFLGIGALGMFCLVRRYKTRAAA